MKVLRLRVLEIYQRISYFSLQYLYIKKEANYKSCFFFNKKGQIPRQQKTKKQNKNISSRLLQRKNSMKGNNVKIQINGK